MAERWLSAALASTEAPVPNGIWGTNAETEGSPRQLMRVVDMINERQPAALFWETLFLIVTSPAWHGIRALK